MSWSREEDKKDSGWKYLQPANCREKLNMKTWMKVAFVAMMMLAPMAAQAEPLEQPCPSGQTWDCDTYPGTEATCGCRRWRDSIPAPGLAPTEGHAWSPRDLILEDMEGRLLLKQAHDLSNDLVTSQSNQTCPYGLAGMYDDSQPTTDDVGEWWHWDECLGVEWWCAMVESAHNQQRCSNGDGTYDLSCWEVQENTPKQDSVECDSDLINRPHPYTGWDRLTDCMASATVYCPGQGTGGWITFQASKTGNSANNTVATCQTGVLRVDAQGHPDKGVACQGAGAPVECGCHVASAYVSTLYGKRTQIGLNSYECIQ